MEVGSSCSFSLVVASHLLLVCENDSVVSSSDPSIVCEDLSDTHGEELVSERILPLWPVFSFIVNI